MNLEFERQRKLFLAAGADTVPTTLLEARDCVAQFDSSGPTASHPEATVPGASGGKASP